MMRALFCLVALLLILSPKDSEASTDTLTVFMTRAALRAALIYGPAPSQSEAKWWPTEGERSIPLAFGMSAILPGAGQFYNRQKLKALLAVSLEAAAITGYFALRSRGLSVEDDFQDEAHAAWSPTKYASWLNDYSEYLGSEFGAVISAPSVTIISGVDFQNPSTWSESDQVLVRAMFEEINAVERQVFHPETGAVFSHQLPSFADQQYYELIGKYFQFAPGWEDYAAWKNAEGVYQVSIDPEHTGVDGSKPNVSDSFFDYASDHARSQDLLRRASQISLLVLLNHVIAGVDAAVSAKLHNDRLKTRMGLAYNGAGQVVPVVQVSFRF